MRQLIHDRVRAKRTLRRLAEPGGLDSYCISLIEQSAAIDVAQHRVDRHRFGAQHDTRSSCTLGSEQRISQRQSTVDIYVGTSQVRAESAVGTARVCARVATGQCSEHQLRIGSAENRIAIDVADFFGQHRRLQVRAARTGIRHQHQARQAKRHHQQAGQQKHIAVQSDPQ